MSSISEEAMELARLESDRERYQVELQNEMKKMSFMLKNGMGEDMKDVLSGKTKIKIPLWKQIKIKVNCFIDNFLKRF